MAFKTIKKQLYGDDIELIFNPKARNRYLVNDRANGQTVYPPGVTTILRVIAKDGLALWPMWMALNHIKANGLPHIDDEGKAWLLVDDTCLEYAESAHAKRSDKGKDVGSEVHEAIEQYLSKAKAVVSSAEAKKAFAAFTSWFDKTQPKVLATEEIVYSREHNFGGTFDALLEIDSQTILCDIKTTNTSKAAPLGVYPEYFLQLGAYSLAWHEENAWQLSDGPDDLMVINASKEGVLSTLRASELGLSVQDCEAAFRSVLAAYKFLEPLKLKIKENNHVQQSIPMAKSQLAVH